MEEFIEGLLTALLGTALWTVTILLWLIVVASAFFTLVLSGYLIYLGGGWWDILLFPFGIFVTVSFGYLASWFFEEFVY